MSAINLDAQRALTEKRGKELDRWIMMKCVRLMNGIEPFSPTLSDLPTEIIHQVLEKLEPVEVIKSRELCRSIRNVVVEGSWPKPIPCSRYLAHFSRGDSVFVDELPLESRNLQSLSTRTRYSEYSDAPSRREMRIASPPLQPTASSTISSVASTSGPLPSIQHLQSSSTALESQNLQSLSTRTRYSEYSDAPSRREMRIASPPLQPTASSTISSVAATPGPLPSIQHLQSSSTGLGSQQNLQNSHNSEQRNVQNMQNMQNMHQNQYNSSQNPPIPIQQIGASSHQHDQGSQGPGGKPQAYHLVQQGSQQQQQQQQATLQRRNAAAAGSNVQFIKQQLQQQQSGGQGQSFVVMGSQSSSNDGQGGEEHRPSEEEEDHNSLSNSSSHNKEYSTFHKLPIAEITPTETLPGGGRLYVDHNRHPYPMSSNVVPVRVLPATQQGQQRMMTGQLRPAPALGTVAAMVLPNRGGGGIPQMRNWQRGWSRVVQELQGGLGGPQGIRRPLVGRPLQRGVDNQD